MFNYPIDRMVKLHGNKVNIYIYISMFNYPIDRMVKLHGNKVNIYIYIYV